ncbi:MAG: calcium-binding protein [Pseudomonadota bacterium]
MPAIRFFPVQEYLFRYTDLDDYEIAWNNLNQIAMNYSEDLAGRPFDPERSPARIRLQLEGATTFVPEEGPNAGETLYTGGSITKVSFFSEANQLQVQITDIDFPLSTFQSMVTVGELFRTYDAFVAGGSTFNGSRISDDIATGFGDDRVFAGAGNDYIKDKGGSDRYFGGAGDNDTVTYDEWFWDNPEQVISGIDVDLAQERVIGPDGNRDFLRSIEEVRGTFTDDVFRGDGNDNGFYGLGGEDFFDGRGGFDIIYYRRDDDQGGTAGVRVNMFTREARDGFGQIDTFVNIEGAVGSNTNDVFDDAAGDNYYDGRDGDDWFYIARGNDVIRGNEGADRFFFRGNNFGDNEIRDFERSEGDLISIRNASSFGDLTITDNGNGDAVIAFANGTVTVEGWSESELMASDFIFV